MRILVSAGEASGDMYAAQLVYSLRQSFPEAAFFGCTGPRLREAGVQTVIESEVLSVVGLAEVVGHLPGIYREYRRLLRAVKNNPPDAAILTDSPDFHLRLARHLKALNIPVFYLVAPQVWAWRQNRVKIIRERVRMLFCLFPFEEDWFRERGVNARYIGHPLAARVRPRWSKEQFSNRYALDEKSPLLALLPGSRRGEALRHMPELLDAVALLSSRYPTLQFVLATPHGFAQRDVFATFRERIAALSIKVIEDETWDVLAHATLALAASGTVTVEAAVLTTPMVTFYKVTSLTWTVGRRLVKAPYLSMVNLIAGEMIVPELIQEAMTANTLAEAAGRLLDNEGALAEMRGRLQAVKQLLTGPADPLHVAASLITEELGHLQSPCATGERRAPRATGDNS